MIENRWYTPKGKKKRIPSELEPFADFAHEVRQQLIDGKVAGVAVMAAARFVLPIPDAQVFTTYFFGIYDNGREHMAFTLENYVHGRRVAMGIVGRK